MLRCLSRLILVQAPMVFADPEGEVNYRKGVFRAGGHMSAMGAIMRQGVYTDELAYRKRHEASQRSPPWSSLKPAKRQN